MPEPTRLYPAPHRLRPGALRRGLVLALAFAAVASCAHGVPAGAPFPTAGTAR